MGGENDMSEREAKRGVQAARCGKVGKSDLGPMWLWLDARLLPGSNFPEPGSAVVVAAGGLVWAFCRPRKVSAGA